MPKTKEIPFKDVEVGQEFASVEKRPACGGYRIKPVSVRMSQGVRAGQTFTAVAVILFDHAGNVPDDAGMLVSMDPNEKVHVFDRNGHGDAGARSTVIGALMRRSTP